jgi:nucleoside-diphosphate-sugar epimerase
MKVILGTGQLGLAVMDVLLQDNPRKEILLVNRSGKLPVTLASNVQVMAADVTDKHALVCIARDAEIIFSCTDVPYNQWADFYPACSKALAYALSKSNARLVFADNLYSYGNVKGERMYESMHHNASTKKGMIRASVIDVLLVERIFNDRVAFVKAADFIGPKIYKGIFGVDFLHKLYQHKTIDLFGKPALPHTFTYIKDFARAMVNVSNAADAFGQLWHVPNAPAINSYEWVKLFETETGIKAKVRIMPRFALQIAGMFNSFVKELQELAYQFEYPYLVGHARYESRFGDHSTPHRIIVKETVEWYKTTLLNKEELHS